MIKFTLDTNCLIDVDENRQAAKFVLRLLGAFNTSKIDLALVASSASERQKSGEYLESFCKFKIRTKVLGFDGLPILPSLARWDVSFWDNGLWADDESEKREKAIYETLFPGSPYEWSDFAYQNNQDTEDRSTKVFSRWLNQIIDAQAYWAHDYAGRDVFVTSDKNFKKRLKGNPLFKGALIASPKESLKLLLDED